MRLAGKIAIVTGAASGIGRAVAQRFASEGARVLAVDVAETALAQAHAGQESIATLAIDIAADDAPDVIVAASVERFGSLDVLVNNAGVAVNKLAELTSDEEWDRVLDVNLRAMFRLCRRAVPLLRERGGGRIINVASVMAEDTDIGLAAYTASKHGVAGLTKTLALELGKHAITANYLLPGAIYTGMTRASFDHDAIRAVWEKKSALRRIGSPEDLAGAALFLAGDDASFITGHGLVVDGGLRLRC